MFDPAMSKEHENSYMLATIIGKRAVQLMKGSHMLTPCDSTSKVSIAICEYKEDKLTYTSNESSGMDRIVENK